MSIENKATRLFIKIQRKTLLQIKDKHPFIYLERGKLVIDDSSVKWIDSEGNIVRLPIATINCLFLGPGTSITHEAVKIISTTNCMICWVGEDSMLFYACGASPTANTRNLKKQIQFAGNSKKSLAIARKMFLKRFENIEVDNKNLQEMMGMEGKRIKQLYSDMAEKYNISWSGRSYTPGKFELSDITNKILTAANAALYGILSAAVYSMGFSPHIGFIHSGSPLPFVYDLADLYKEYICIDLAFSLTFELGGEYNRYRITEEFRKRVVDFNLLSKIPADIKYLFDL